jgi:RimJ/RimL family protein N-acetyltransferase
MRLSGDLSKVGFSSARLTMTSFAAADVADSFAEANERIATYMSWNPSSSEADHRAVLQSALANMKAGTDLHLIVRRTDTGEFIGSTGVHPAGEALLETGIWIKEAAQRRGYGREAVAAVVGWASVHFQPSGFLYPVVDVNTPSCRLAESLGGKIEGTRQRQKSGDAMRTLLLYVIPATT